MLFNKLVRNLVLLPLIDLKIMLSVVDSEIMLSSTVH